MRRRTIVPCGLLRGLAIQIAIGSTTAPWVNACPVQDSGRVDAESMQQQEAIRQELELLDASLRIDGRSDNAATHYRELFRELIQRQHEYNTLVNAVYAREDEHLTDEVLYQTPEMAAYLEEVRRYRALIRKAVDSERVDFGLKREDGINMRIPHLAHMRSLARQLRRTSRDLRINGNILESSEDLSLILGMAAHVGPDRTLISSLVAAAIANVALNEIELALTDRQVDRISAEPLLKALRPLGAGDPFHFSGAIDGEYESLEFIFAEEDQSREQLEEILTSVLDMVDPNGAGLPGQGVEDVRAWVLSEMKLSKPLYDRLSDLMTLEDRLAARRETRAIMLAVEEGKYGRFNEMIMPGIGRTIDIKHFQAELVEYVITALEAIQDGADPGRFGNAALVYEQTMEMLPRRIRPRDQTTLNMLQQLVGATGSCDQVDAEMLEEARRIIDREQDLIEMIHRAARVDRCSWRSARMRALAEEAIGEGDWVRPMRAMMRLMLAEAAVAFCNPDTNQARSQVESSLAAALGICLQLNDGSHLFGQLASTASLEELERYLEQACWKGLVSRSAAKSMQQRLQRTAIVNLAHWRLASDAMIDQDLFDLIQAFGTSNRADAMVLGKRWSRERLFILSLCRMYQEHSDEGDGHLEPRINFVNEMDSTGDRGELFTVEDILALSPEERDALEQPVARLLDLLNRIDSIKSPKIAEWQLRCSACLDRLDTILANCSAVPTKAAP